MHRIAWQPDAAKPRVVHLPDEILRAYLLTLVHQVQGLQLARWDARQAQTVPPVGPPAQCEPRVQNLMFTFHQSAEHADHPEQPRADASRFSAQVAKQHRRVRPGEHPGQVKDMHTGQRPALGCRSPAGPACSPGRNEGWVCDIASFLAGAAAARRMATASPPRARSRTAR